MGNNTRSKNPFALSLSKGFGELTTSGSMNKSYQVNRWNLRISIAALLYFLWSALRNMLKLLSAKPQRIRQVFLRMKSSNSKSVLQRGKPAWVKSEVLRLKALMPTGTGVRKIAATFNRMHCNHAQLDKRQRISKTYVAKLISNNLLEIHNIRKQVRARAPSASRVNVTWGVDVTGRCSSTGQLHSILGIIDHGSRRLLSLVVSSKHALQLAAHVTVAVLVHGKPKFVRTDNERCFTGQAFADPLALQGIQPQRSDMHCPWQNGRIERVFGTLKQYLNMITFDTREQLQVLLDEFMTWYNTIRPHQHLEGRTPFEVWHAIDYKKAKPKSIEWWTGWDGMLSGARLRWI
jgi:putative transposase